MSIYKLVKSEKRDIQEMIDYIRNEDKTSEEYVYTMGLNVEYAMQDMVFTRIMFGKFSSNTRPYYQFIIALDEKLDTADDSLARFELLIKTVTYLLACGCDNKRPEFQVLSAIHIYQRPYYHAHFMVNPISSIDGHILSQNHRFFWLIRNMVNRLLIHFGFSCIPDERLNERSTLPQFI